MRNLIDLSGIIPKEYAATGLRTGLGKSRTSILKDDGAFVPSVGLDENIKLLSHHYPSKILFTLDETAKILNVSYEFIRYRVTQEIIPAISFGDRWMINIKTIAELLTNGVK